MFQINWISWLGGFIALLLIGTGGSFYLSALEQNGAAIGVAAGFNALIVAWVAFALIKWHEQPWVKRLTGVILGTVVMAALIGIAYFIGSTKLIYAFLGMYGMGLTFYIGMFIVRSLLFLPLPCFAVARTLIDEAIRLKFAVVFIAVMIVFIPLLPVLMRPEEQIHYRLQYFLVWSMLAVTSMLGLMTALLAVRTITSDLNKRQIYMTLTKPIGRLEYLFGKWLGIMLLNLVLVTVSGVAIYANVQAIASERFTLPERHVHRIAVEERILTARQLLMPSIDLSGAYARQIEVLRDQFESENAGEAFNEYAVQEQVRDALKKEWLTIGPMERKRYEFVGLSALKEATKTVQLRLMPRASGGSTADGRVQLFMLFNGRTSQQVLGQMPPRMSESNFHILDIPTWIIDDNGMLVIEIANLPVNGVPQPTISLHKDDGLHLLYKVGDFTPNLVKTMFLVWVRLSFVAMLGLACGTFLGFPVACILALMVFLAAVGTNYINDSFEFYAKTPPSNLTLMQQVVWVPAQFFQLIGEGEIWDAIKMIIWLIGSSFMLLVPDMAGYSPVNKIKDGIYISWELMIQAVLLIGIASTAAMTLVGYLLFRFREVARVIV